MIRHAMKCERLRYSLIIHLLLTGLDIYSDSVPSVTRIVYSTCSVYAIENEVTIVLFLSEILLTTSTACRA